MTDDKTDFVSKADLQAIMASFEQKLSTLNASHLKEMELKENQIHSSYTKKLKKLGISEEAEGDEELSNRKATKKEMELQANVEKLVKKLEDTDKRVRQAEQYKSTSEKMLNSGINPKAIDTVYTLLQARNAFVESEDGSIKLKVDVAGVGSTALPLEDALKHFTKSDEGQLFMAPLGTNGSGGKTGSTPKTAATGNEDIPLYKRFAVRSSVDWKNAATEMGIGNRTDNE